MRVLWPFLFYRLLSFICIFLSFYLFGLFTFWTDYLQHLMLWWQFEKSLLGHLTRTLQTAVHICPSVHIMPLLKGMWQNAYIEKNRCNIVVQQFRLCLCKWSKKPSNEGGKNKTTSATKLAIIRSHNRKQKKQQTIVGRSLSKIDNNKNFVFCFPGLADVKNVKDFEELNL